MNKIVAYFAIISVILVAAAPFAAAGKTAAVGARADAVQAAAAEVAPAEAAASTEPPTVAADAQGETVFYWWMPVVALAIMSLGGGLVTAALRSGRYRRRWEKTNREKP